MHNDRRRCRSCASSCRGTFPACPQLAPRQRPLGALIPHVRVVKHALMLVVLVHEPCLCAVCLPADSPLAGHARWGQNMVAGSMMLLFSWRCWGAYPVRRMSGPPLSWQPSRTTVKWGAPGEPTHAGTVACCSASCDGYWGRSQRKRGEPVILLRFVTASLLLSTLLLAPTALWAATDQLRNERTPAT
jgi:hypothetical protein